MKLAVGAVWWGWQDPAIKGCFKYYMGAADKVTY